MEQYPMTITRRSNGWTVQLAGHEVDVPSISEINTTATLLLGAPAVLDLPFPELVLALLGNDTSVSGYANVLASRGDPEDDEDDEREDDGCRECHRASGHKLDCTNGRARRTANPRCT